MRVLIIGHRGYIGSVLTRVLRHGRFDVVGTDSDLYNACGFGRMVQTVPDFACDFDELSTADLLSFDAVVHLAGPPEVDSTMHSVGGSAPPGEAPFIRFAHRARHAGINRFVLVSTCDVYGRTGSRQAAETSPLQPGSATARAALIRETAVSRLASNGFSPTVLRVPSVYGVSPRLRLDLIVNDLVAAGYTTGRVDVPLGGAGWRSLVHVEDLCRIIAAVLIAPRELVHHNIFNVVAPHDTHRVIDIADAVAEGLHCARSGVSDWYDDDSLRVDGSKLRRDLPQFAFHWTLHRGISQLAHAFHCNGLTAADHRSDRYRRSLARESAHHNHHRMREGTTDQTALAG